MEKINDMRGSLFTANNLLINSSQVFYCGFPVDKITISDRPLFKSPHLFDVISKGFKIGEIALKENDSNKVKNILQ